MRVLDSRAWWWERGRGLEAGGRTRLAGTVGRHHPTLRELEISSLHHLPASHHYSVVSSLDCLLSCTPAVCWLLQSPPLKPGGRGKCPGGRNYWLVTGGDHTEPGSRTSVSQSVRAVSPTRHSSPVICRSHHSSVDCSVENIERNTEREWARLGFIPLNLLWGEW